MDIYHSHGLPSTHAYGILCAAVPKSGDRASLYPTYCRIPVGESSTRHAHFEAEIFYIVSGQGRMTIGHETSPVTSGDIVRIPAFANHELANSGTEELEFLSVYSEDSELPALPPSVTITAAPPTPNGPLHLGHIAGPYLAADVMSRYLRLRGVRVQSHSGTDDSQNYVEERALSLGLDPADFRQQMRARIQHGFQTSQITFDEFIEPATDQVYKDATARFAQKALAKGVITRETLAMPYCEVCDHLLVDVLIEGDCPECAEVSRGGCESCGVVVPPQDLLHPHCTRCQRAATPKDTAVYTFQLGRFLPAVSADLQALSLPVRLRGLVDRVQQRSDLKVLVGYPGSRDGGLQWHVWFEMAAYFERFATNDFWIHSFGFDNGFHYLLFFPALLRALNPSAKLPAAVVTNEFLLLEGTKFSTSRGHALWADEFHGDADHLRLFLSLERPGTAESNFVAEEFQRFSNKLRVTLDGFLSQGRGLATLTGRNVSPAVLVDCNRHTRDMERYFSPAQFDPRRAARQLLAFSDLVSQNLNASVAQNFNASVAQNCNASVDARMLLRTFAVTAAPVMPAFSQALQMALGENGAWLTDWSAAV